MFNMNQDDILFTSGSGDSRGRSNSNSSSGGNDDYDFNRNEDIFFTTINNTNNSNRSSSSIGNIRDNDIVTTTSMSNEALQCLQDIVLGLGSAFHDNVGELLEGKYM